LVSQTKQGHILQGPDQGRARMNPEAIQKLIDLHYYVECECGKDCYPQSCEECGEEWPCTELGRLQLLKAIEYPKIKGVYK